MMKQEGEECVHEDHFQSGGFMDDGYIQHHKFLDFFFLNIESHVVYTCNPNTLEVEAGIKSHSFTPTQQI